MIWTKSKINHVFIFEFDTRHALEWRQLLEVCLCICDLGVRHGLWLTATVTILLLLPFGSDYVAQFLNR